MKNVPPSLDLIAFNCPYCRAFAHQHWLRGTAYWLGKEKNLGNIIVDIMGADRNDPKLITTDVDWRSSPLNGVMFSRCASCEKLAIWVHDRIVFPQTGEAPAANPDMPDDIRRDYEEASAILEKSPRGAAALIRLAIQKLCKVLGQPGKNINDDIGALVKKGLDPRVQKALDAVRVIGNSAVHPGQIDIRDDRTTAEALFKLLNLIVEKTISEPKHVEEVYASLPQGAIEAIAKRDGK